MNNELISIIMPAYNAEGYIEESICSVIKQSYLNWELIIVNDGSTDRTQQIAEKYSREDGRIKVINQKNARLGAARNTGIRNSVGSWIAFLDADDLWESAKLEKQLGVSEQFEDVDVIYTDGWIFNGNDLGNLAPYPTVTGKYLADTMYKMQYQTNHIPVLSVIAKKEIVDKIGFQEEHPCFYGCEDWDYWLRMARAGANFYGLNDKLFYYRRHNSNMSSNNVGMNLAHASVFIKNFEVNRFNKKQTADIFKHLIYNQMLHLIMADRKQDAYYLLNGIKNIWPTYKNPLYRFYVSMLNKDSALILNKWRDRYQALKRSIKKLIK